NNKIGVYYDNAETANRSHVHRLHRRDHGSVCAGRHECSDGKAPAEKHPGQCLWTRGASNSCRSPKSSQLPRGKGCRGLCLPRPATVRVRAELQLSGTVLWLHLSGTVLWLYLSGTVLRLCL